MSVSNINLPFDHILLAVPRETPLSEALRGSALSAEDVQAGRHMSDSCLRSTTGEFRELEFILLQKGNNLYDRSIHMFEEAGFAPKVKMALSAGYGLPIRGQWPGGRLYQRPHRIFHPLKQITVLFHRFPASEPAFLHPAAPAELYCPRSQGVY